MTNVTSMQTRDSGFPSMVTPVNINYKTKVKTRPLTSRLSNEDRYFT